MLYVVAILSWEAKLVILFFWSYLIKKVYTSYVHADKHLIFPVYLYIDSVLYVQFQDVGSHGTKVAVYNLWMNDDGLLELDFEDDDEVSVNIIFIASIQ
jgi:hypothetical protein